MSYQISTISIELDQFHYFERNILLFHTITHSHELRFTLFKSSTKTRQKKDGAKTFPTKKNSIMLSMYKEKKNLHYKHKKFHNTVLLGVASNNSF